MNSRADLGTLTLPGMEDVGLSPIRRQYLELKRRQPDAILLFRLGDFYETFEDDAHLAARVLDITLTSREMGRGERLPMAGIPVHAADTYIARLIAAGIPVAIAEQLGTVARNGIVPRGRALFWRCARVERPQRAPAGPARARRLARLRPGGPAGRYPNAAAPTPVRHRRHDGPGSRNST